MQRNPLRTHYISEIDQFLQEFDAKNPKLSSSQERERAKEQWLDLSSSPKEENDP